MKKALFTLVVVTFMVAILVAPATAVAACQPSPPLFFMEQDQREVHVWEGQTYSRFATAKPMLYVGLANERMVTLELLELAGIRVLRLPSSDPLSMSLLFVGTHPGNWIWARIRDGVVLQVRSNHGLDLRETHWTAWHQDMVAPDGAFSFGLFQFLIEQLGLGVTNLLPTISPSGEIVEEGALMLWLWHPMSEPFIGEKGGKG